MVGRLNTDAAQAAVNLCNSHPQATPLEILDLVLRGRTGAPTDLGNLHPTSPFGQLVAAAFDRAMDPRDWNLIDHPSTDVAVRAVLWDIWQEQVLPAFAARYALTA